MKLLNYSAISSLRKLAARAAQVWNRALQHERLIIETHVNVANVIINFGKVDRTQDALAALLHEFGHVLGLPHSDIFSDVMHRELGSTVISTEEAARARAFLKL